LPRLVEQVSVLWLPAFVLGLAFLFLIISFGAIVAIGFRNRRPGLSYFAGGMTTEKRNELVERRISGCPSPR
jgi:hypothetical protein